MVGEGSGMIGFLLLALLNDPMFQLVWIAFAAAVSIIALSYMLGEVFGMHSLKGFAKVELADLIASALIVLIAIGLATPGGVFDQVTKGFMLATGPTQCVGSPPDRNIAFAQAEYFLGCAPEVDMGAVPPTIKIEGVLMKRLTLAYASLMGNEMFFGLLSGFSTNLEVPIPIMLLKINVGMTPWIAMGPINDIHTVLVDAVGVAWAGVATQKMLLAFVEESALTIFLPFGLLLRAFPFSRKTGSTIVAVVFAAYFIYPTTLLINYRIWDMVSDPKPDPSVPPGLRCLENGVSCTDNSKCCSLNCNLVQATGSRVCTSPLTEFSEYNSVFAVCAGSGYTPDQVNQILEGKGKGYEDRLMSTYFNPGHLKDAYAATPGTKAEKRVFNGWTEAQRKLSLITGTGGGLWFPTPQNAVTGAFKALDSLVMDAMQFTVLVLLFMVIEIIITMTLLKDFSLLIGGEPRVFGMSKLV